MYKVPFMHQSFVSTAPPPTGMGGDNGFTFQSPVISPALWGQANDNNPALYPTAAVHLRRQDDGFKSCQTDWKSWGWNSGALGTTRASDYSTIPLLVTFPR